MSLFFNSDIQKLYLGSSEVQEVYLGSTLVWSAGLPIGTTFDFGYTGNVQSVELPRGKYKLQCWGAQGGTSYGSSNGAGSKGGYSEGVLVLTEKTTLYVFVGGQGSRGSSTSLVNGGWNGGGASVGYASYNSGNTNGASYPACGGGATDISTVTSSMSYSSGRTNRSSASLLARCIVAGGGAGGSYRYTEEIITNEVVTTVQRTNYGTFTVYSSSEQCNYGQIMGLSDATGYYTLYNGYSVSVGCTFYSSSNSRLGGLTVSAGGAVEGTFPSGTAWIQIYLYSATNYVSSSGYLEVNFFVNETTTETSTSTSSGYSNKSQQGGGTSGKGQYPGSQTSAGSCGGFGYGANQATTNYRYCAGGGGGGWYGGGTNHSDSSTSYVNYSGGGSGFVNTSANASSRPNGYTGLQLESGTTTAGSSFFPSTSGGTETGHSGNGYARITVIK